MQNITDFLRLLGINITINDSTSPIVLFACVILVLSIIALLCFINIVIYFTVLYLTEHKIFIDKISEYKYILKIINIYRKTRLPYLLFEIILYLICSCSIIWFCIRIIYGLT